MEITVVGAENSQLVVAGPIHNNEHTGREVIEYVKGRPAPGVLPYLVPHEVAVGTRFAGKMELGSHGCGDEYSDDPEARVAARMHADLQVVDYWLGIDIHDSPQKEANYMVVGDVLTPEQLGMAILLSINRIVNIPHYPFFKTYPKFASIETTRDPTNNPMSDPEHWRDQLQLAAAIGVDGLRWVFETCKTDLRYFKKYELPLVGPNAFSLNEIEPLEDIIVSDKAFGEVTLPTDISNRLGIQNRWTGVNSWNYLNNSRRRPDFGCTRQGTQRREWFGSIFTEVDPPVAIDQTSLRFE